MRVEFTYTPDELRQARASAGRQQPWSVRPAVTRFAAGVFVGLGIVILLVIPLSEMGSPARWIAAQGGRSTLVALPTATLALIAAGLAVARRWTPPSSRSYLRSPTTVAVSDDGVTVEHEAITPQVGWAGFDRFVETDLFLIVRMREGRGSLEIPKRAVDRSDLDALRDRLSAGVTRRTVAFPVVQAARPA